MGLNTDLLPNLPEEKSMAEEVEARDELQYVDTLMERLPPKERKVFRMHMVDDLSYNEIEQDTGLSQANIRQIVRRTKQKLKQQFQQITKTWTS